MDFYRYNFDAEVRHEVDYLTFSVPQGRLFVIPDIHGCALTFRNLLTKLNLEKNDFLVLLGDYINKGNDSVGVLDTILELLEMGHNVWPLLGNHEKMLLDVHYGHDKSANLVSLFLRNGLIDEDCKIKLKYRKLLINLPLYIVVGNNYFVHAGFNFNSPSPFEDFESMIWIRNFNVPSDFKGRIFHGHVPTNLPAIEMNIRNSGNKICLDNGCFSKDKWFLGNLLCLEVKTGNLLLEVNCE